jgi:tetratricopeptide (TPR) repeat protein
MNVANLSFARLVLLALALGSGGCSELSARSHAREGNRLYRDGDYPGAVREYTEAERLKPNFPVILFNKGIACRQLMLPGAKSKENDRAVDCALAAFSKMKETNPADPRGDQLYVQTLFDADRYETLVGIFEKKVRAQPGDLLALSGLIQVYTRWGRWEQALHWMMERAKVDAKNAEAHYAVGVFVWNELFQGGGGQDKASWDPRPGATNAEPATPLFGTKDIYGERRVKLADLGISHLLKAIEIRPHYREAMTYVNLLYRQKSFAFFDRPEEWQKAIDSAEEWRKKAMSTPAH